MEQPATTPVRAKAHKKSAGNGKPLTQTITVNYVNRPSILELITPELKIHSAVTITPEMAEELLTLNANNRPITKAIVNRYANAMLAGKWRFAGNTFKYSVERKCLDGQHTQMALVKAGQQDPNITIRVNIQTGLDPQDFTVMDSGRLRSAGDVVAMRGYKEYYATAAAIKSCIYYGTIGRLRTNLRYDIVSNQEVDKWLDRPADTKLMVQCIQYAVGLRHQHKGSFLAASTWAFIYFQLLKVNREMATQFITLLASGENLSMENNNPIYLLRETLLSFMEKHYRIAAMGGSLIVELKVRYIFKAWNAWRRGEKLQKLSLGDLKGDEKIEKPV